MELATTFNVPYDIYGEINFKTIDLNNKLFCTFTQEQYIDDIVADLSYKYTILYNKIFVLEVKDNNEYVLTYNMEWLIEPIKHINNSVIKIIYPNIN